MSVHSLALELLGRPSFKSRLDALTIDSVAAQFGKLKRDQVDRESHEWNYLLTSASLFAQASDSVCEDAALRIAHHCLTAGPENECRDAACVILDTLTNKASIALAESRGLVQPSFERRLPFRLKLDWLRRDLEFKIFTGNEGELSLNRFQKQLWDATRSAEVLSISAPTSSGKSFALCHWLSEHIRTNPSAFIIYLVPTRALIQQVENDLREHFREARLPSINVSSLPLASSIKSDSTNVLVLTQERLHILLISIPQSLSPSILIVDEAQKVGDGARGVLLQNVIDSVVRRSPSTSLFFASPMVSNPELLLSGRSTNRNAVSFASTHVTVNQNLLWVSQKAGNTKLWNVELCIGDSMARLGEIELQYRPAPDSKRLPFVAHALADPAGGNLIYSNTASEAEKTAHQLWDVLGDAADVTSDPDIAGLIELVKKAIHTDYAMAECLKRGIAFHYGNMPLLIRTEVERLFKANRIHYLICTSTLIEGVNLPCKSIFVRGPRKGIGKPMSEADFWNLAGRAGRLGKEFQGNVICIDPRRPEVWKNPPPKRRGTFHISRASDAVLNELDQFIEHLEAAAPIDSTQNTPEYDQLLTYLITQFSEGTGLETCPACVDLSPASRQRLEASISKIRESIDIPLGIVERNPGITPFAMQRLMTYFRGRETPVDELIPALPESDVAVENYNKVFSRINSHLSPVFAGRTFALALLVVNWMRGHSLARIISSRIHYNVSRSRDYELSTLIRGVMDDVEQIARFQAPKYLTCYTDLLKLHLGLIDRADLVETVPDVNIWLEFGASQLTQLSLMGLGLSRTTAISISELIADDNLTEDAVLRKLREFNLASLSLPRAIVREVEVLLGTPVPQVAS